MLENVIKQYHPKKKETTVSIFKDDEDAYYAEVDGKPITMEALIKLREYFDQILKLNKDIKATIKFDGIIPEGLLYFDFDTYTDIKWISKSKIRTLIFASPTIKGQFEVLLPDMVFEVIKGEYKVFFIDDKKNRYYAPFFNNNDKMCMGQQKKIDPGKYNSIQEYINALEDVFFLSPFTHAGSVKTNTRLSVVKYWEAVTKRNRKLKFKDFIIV